MLSSAIAFNLEQSRILSFGKELKPSISVFEEFEAGFVVIGRKFVPMQYFSLYHLQKPFSFDIEMFKELSLKLQIRTFYI